MPNRSALNVATSCANMAMISRDRNSAGETFAYFCTFVKNGYIWPIISEQARPISINYSTLIDIWVGIINLDVHYEIAQGTLFTRWSVTVRTPRVDSRAALAIAGIPRDRHRRGHGHRH